MRFATSVMALVASAAVSAAGTVTFWTLDNLQRTLYFTGNPGSAEIQPVTVNSQKNTTVEFTVGWVGNFYAIPDGQKNVPGMLGEVNFSGWLDRVYFDVSAIVAPTDHNNVKQMWPVGVETPMSGCANMPCNNVYWLPDDIQTKSTNVTDLMCTLGAGSTGISFAEAN